MGRKKSKASFGSGIALLLLPVVVILAVGFIWRFKNLLQQSRLGSAERVNVVFIQSPPAFVSIDKKEHSAKVIFLDGKIYLPLAGGYGNYLLETAYSVGELDKRGGQVIAMSVASLLGVPVDAYIKLPNGRVLGNDRDVKADLVDWRLLWEQSRTNLSWLDLVNLNSLYRELRFDQIDVTSLSKLAVLSDLILADGTVAQLVDQDKLDYNLDSELIEKNLRAEGLKVEVLNVSGTAGLGAKAARILTNVGLSVVNVNNGDMPVVGCEVRAQKSAEHSVTARRVAEIFGCKILTKSEGRADITLILQSLRLGGLQL